MTTARPNINETIIPNMGVCNTEVIISFTSTTPVG